MVCYTYIIRNAAPEKGCGSGVFAMKHPAQWTILYIIGFFQKNPCIMGKDEVLYVRCASGPCVPARANNNQRHAFAGGCRLCHPGNFRKVPTIRATGQGARPKYFRKETLGRVYSPHTKRRKTTWQIRRFVSS